MKLLERPNGAWIDPLTINAVLPFPGSQTCKSSVTICYGNEVYSCIPFKSYDEAVKFAAELGKTINDRWREGMERLEEK